MNNNVIDSISKVMAKRCIKRIKKTARKKIREQLRSAEPREDDSIEINFHFVFKDIKNIFPKLKGEE